MGLLGKDSKKHGDNPGTTVVARGTHIVGTIELTDSFHLDGFMKGTVSSENDVSIGQSGSFEGEVRARRILVSGEFDGKLDAERLEIVASGRVTGEITVSELVIESGGQFSGSSHIKGSQSEPALLGYRDAENGEEKTLENSHRSNVE